MKKANHALMQVDAFTDHPLGGNPCAIVFDCEDLDSETMQAIALEMNLSETAFVMASEVADFKARYFTPAEEIPMAGHPTIATTYALVQSGRLPLDQKGVQTFTLELPVGPIRVDIESDGTSIERIVMTQKKPVFTDMLEAADVMPQFDLQESDLLPGAVIQVVSTGTPQLMIPLRSIESLRKAMINVRGYLDLRATSGFFSAHLFCLEGATPEGTTFARHFGTPPDAFEDPFTGSATGGMAAYLWHYGFIDSPTFVAEQGHWMTRPGKADVEVVGPPNDIVSVKIGGQAALVFTGELHV